MIFKMANSYSTDPPVHILVIAKHGNSKQLIDSFSGDSGRLSAYAIIVQTDDYGVF